MSDSFLDHAVRASLVDMLDKRVLIVLRDNRKLIGWLRTFDQFSNVVMEKTVERKTLDKIYTDVEVGLYLIRGENIVILGEMDPLKPSMPGMKKVPVAEFEAADKAAKELAKKKMLANPDMHNSFETFDL